MTSVVFNLCPLLPPSPPPSQHGTYVENVKEEVVLSAAHALSLISSGEGMSHRMRMRVAGYHARISVVSRSTNPAFMLDAFTFVYAPSLLC